MHHSFAEFTCDADHRAQQLNDNVYRQQPTQLRLHCGIHNTDFSPPSGFNWGKFRDSKTVRYAYDIPLSQRAETREQSVKAGAFCGAAVGLCH